MKLTVLACVVAAAFTCAAATAAGGVRPDDRAGPRGAGVTILSTSLRPDDRAGFRGVAHGPYAAALSGRQSVHEAGRGFDWSAAAAGAAVATAVVLLFGWALTLRRNNRHAEASA